MNNPSSILLVVVPAYVILSLLTAVIGATTAPRSRLPRGRFFLGLTFSLVALPVALLLHTLGLATLSYLPPLNQTPLTSHMEAGVLISLIAVLVAALVASYYFAFKWRQRDDPAERH